MSFDNRFKFAGLIILITAAISACAGLFESSPDPSSIPIKLDVAGVVADFKFEVKRHFIYSYRMSFHFTENNQEQRASLRKLLGGNGVDRNGIPVDRGTPTPVNLTIFALCKDGREVKVYSQDSDPILTSWGAEVFGKQIGSSRLSAGMYRAQLVNKRPSPEFAQTPITFEMGMPAKISFDPLQDVGGEWCQKAKQA